MFMNRKPQGESFAVQTDRNRLESLTSAVQEFMDARDVSEKAYRHSKIATVLTENHNLSISMTPWVSIGGDDRYFQAAILAPTLSKNNPLIANYKRKFVTNGDHDAIKTIKKERTLSGYVDLEQARVYGIFTEVNCRLCVSTAFFTSDKFTAREVAEIITHEVGHILSYFAALGDVVTYNYAIVNTIERIVGESDHKRRVQLVEELGEGIGVEYDNSDIIAESSSTKTLFKVLVSETARLRRCETGSVTYANHSWERLSDQLVTRMGGGSALATALVKIDKDQPYIIRNSDYTPSSVHYITQVIYAISAIGVTAMFPTFGIPYYTFLAFLYANATDETFQDHDTPERRLKAVERGLVERLKIKNISAEDREFTLSEVALVRNLLTDIKEKPEGLQVFGRILLGKYWGKQKEDAMLRDYMDELETLSANELFITKAQMGA